MHSKVEERKNDLRNTTVLEVILAIIIILLCVVYIKDTTHKDMEKNYIEQIKELKTEREELITENFRLSDENRGLKKDKRELEDEIHRLERKIKRMTALRPRQTALPPIEEEEPELKTEDSEGTGGGIDKPSCLLEGEERAFFADVSEKEGLIDFVQTGSIVNQAKALRVPGATKLFTQGPVTFDQFEIAARAIFEHGQESMPSCVYFIKLDPDQWHGRELKIFERYFYKSYK